MSSDDNEDRAAPAPVSSGPDPEPAPDVAIVAKADRDLQDQTWISAILPILSAYRMPPTEFDGETDKSVQTALDSLIVTACARLKRILRSDVGA